MLGGANAAQGCWICCADRCSEERFRRAVKARKERGEREKVVVDLAAAFLFPFSW